MNSAIVTTGAEHAASDVAREITSLSGSVLERVMRARSGELFAAQLAHQPLDVDIGPMPMHVVAYHIDGSTDVEKRVHGRVTGRRPRIGSVSLIPGGVETGWRIGGANRVAHLFVPQTHLDDYCRDNLGLDIRPEMIDFFDAADPWLSAFFTLLLSEHDAAEGVAGEVESLLLDQLRQRLMRHLVESHTSVGPQRARAAQAADAARLRPAVLRRLVELIESRLCEDIRLKELAAVACQSVDHFTRSFRTTLGCTPYQYVLSRRVDCAKALLRDTDLPIGVVCERAGFNSVCHFSAAFRRKVGASPGSYRSDGKRGFGAPPFASAQRLS